MGYLVVPFMEPPFERKRDYFLTPKILEVCNLHYYNIKLCKNLMALPFNGIFCIKLKDRHSCFEISGD